MADQFLNIGKGRQVEFATRINANDPANSVLLVAVVDASGVESDATLRDKDTVSDFFSGATNELVTSGWARKSLDNTAGIQVLVDDTADVSDVDIPDQTWTGVSAGNSSDLLMAYDSDSTGGTDANVVPVSMHDFAITADGSDVTAQINTEGIWRAA